MENRAKQLGIIKKLNDNRSKLSALFSLYNTSLLLAEDNRAKLSEYYDKMVDLKNDLNEISNLIYTTKKADRETTYIKNKSKIKKIDNDIIETNSSFIDSCNNYRIALKECGSLKTEYKHEISELMKEFKSLVDSTTEPIVIKGYKQQVRVIKAILDRIELLISDYNVKKNKMEDDSLKFNTLYDSVNTLLDKIKNIA